ncbi:2-phospho-L-lactate guanylyltransferase [Nocardioides zhouii]|uniref:2-phospho-L-lactate guanylyltransferase n=1 Tax=Nocardioides zhouii TaxID=1168729 RepID=A0A4Q2T2J1_9ACTN|nr:2-phospho-L-lactate guanylyltransferase [Nocardioides zhouii]RYC12905.1 2-phospho-L-lactate guanylyltransferase [Nocardioides zhouii]
MCTPTSPPVPAPDTTARCVVVVPVKPPALGKSRLVGLSDEQRRELAEAFALDTVQAASRTRGVAAVLVVTDDFRLAAAMRDLDTGVGVEVMPDGASEDLNATLVQAAAEVVRRWPDAVPVALCADLPGLRSDELADVLADSVAEVSAGRAAFVRDRAGVGTTLYAAPHDRFAPGFGPGSAQRHHGAGAVEVGAAATSVRTDVDDLADLGAVLVAGVGPHTSRASGRRATPLG